MSISKNIVFFHPDLGIGGAERLIVDAAVSLQNLGHTVTIYTSYCDKSHCFDEARDGTLDVRVRGNTLPATVLGRFKILLTILRHIHLLISIHFSGELAALYPQVFVLDQLSAGIPLLRTLYPTVPVLFYCHFPDLLLVQGRNAMIRRVWRWPFDALEGWSMRGADRVVVNSAFTRGVVQTVWPHLVQGKGRRELGIVYPCVDTDTEKDTDSSTQEDKPLWPGKKVILSINRFERKKDVGLAIRAFAKLDSKVRKEAKLVIAGGYDAREQENVTYHTELVSLADSLGLQSATAKNMISALATPAEISILFLLSVPSSLKTTLLQTSHLLVYTPRNEHFGIVPLEAMLARTPVLASDTGGPLETVLDGITGWLRDSSDDAAWTEVMELVLARLDETELKKMGEAGRARVLAEFSKEQMGARLDAEIQELLGGARVETLELRDLALWIGLAGFGVLAAFFALLFVPSYG